jgi:hypothetical protein
MHGLSLHHQRRANHVAFVDADGLAESDTGNVRADVAAAI